MSVDSIHKDMLDKYKDDPIKLSNYLLNVGDILHRYYDPSNFNKKTLFDEYVLKLNNDGKLDEICYNICKCGYKLFMDHRQSKTICRHCGIEQYDISDMYKPYEDGVNDTCLSYNKCNHLVDILNQTQGIETTTIPSDVIDCIKREIKNHKISLEKLNIKMVIMLLKNNNYSKYTDHAQQIINHLNDKQMITLPSDLLIFIEYYFNLVEIKFEKYNRTRKNLVSYCYIIHKICLIKPEYAKYSKYFKLLKSSSKLQQSDEIWKQICDDIGIKFIPSI